MIKEETRDLFTTDPDYALVHCISSDFALGAGIALRFNQMGVKKALKENFESKWDGRGYCIRTDVPQRTVYNLITKKNYWHKPTYKTLGESLEDLKAQLDRDDCKRIAMPLIGCGLDKLEWNKVYKCLCAVFKDTDIEILVCKL